MSRILLKAASAAFSRRVSFVLGSNVFEALGLRRKAAFAILSRIPGKDADFDELDDELAPPRRSPVPENGRKVEMLELLLEDTKKPDEDFPISELTSSISSSRSR